MSNVPPPPPPGGEPIPGGTPVPPPPPASLQPPPGYVAYGAAPTPAGRIRRIGGLAKANTVLIALIAAITVFVAILSPGANDAAQDFLDGRTSSTEFTDAIIGYSLVQGAASLLTLAAMIIVMIWMYRMASNLRAFGMSTTWHPLWAVFGWFLPPVLYVIPFLMLRELWARSNRSAPVDSSSSGENATLWVWIVFFSIIPVILTIFQAGSLADQFSSQGAESQANTIVDSGALGVISPLISIGAAVAWILFVRQATERHIALTGER